MISPQYRTCKKCGRRFSFPNEWCKHLNDPVEYPRSKPQYFKTCPKCGQKLLFPDEWNKHISNTKEFPKPKDWIPWKKGKRFVFHTEEEQLHMQREYQRKWRAKNPDKCKSYGANFKRSHPDYRRP